jgi:hypothetical protein
MPILKGKYKFAKIFRPPGTPYAEGEVESNIRSKLAATLTSHIVAGLAIDAANVAFHREFGRYPNPDLLVYEVTLTASKASATVYELSEMVSEEDTE